MEVRVHEHDLRTRGVLDVCAVVDEEVPRVRRDDEARDGLRTGLRQSLTQEIESFQK